MAVNRPLGAVAGGVAGTGVMSVVFVLLEVETRSAIGIFAVIARYVGVPRQLWFGFLLFAVVGSVVWPLLFVALEEYIPRGPDPAVRGLVFAAALWVPFVVLGRGDLAGPVVVVYAAFTFVAHLLYGFTMGAVYATLTGARLRADRPDGRGQRH